MAKHFKKKDPFKEREAEKYQHPVPSREYISEYLEHIVRPMTYKQLVKAFNLSSEEEREGLRRRLRAMERDGQVLRNRRGSYALVKTMQLVAGRIEAHRDGYGFLIPDDGSSDVFIPSREMRKVFHDDRALVRQSSPPSKRRDARREGVIVEVLERNTRNVVGRYIVEGGVSFVDANSKHIFQEIIIPPGEQGNASHGQYVVAELTVQPNSRRQPMGKVIEVLGDHLTPGMEVELSIRSHDIPHVWPEQLIQEAQRYSAEIDEKAIGQREDLRNLPFVTIDGEDAKDFDDAVYCEKRDDGGWNLYVAIADVTYYVKPDSELDAEAQNRGNSVYFPAKVIPMLPEILSNGLCSLKPNVDRLAMLCKMRVSPNGELLHYEFSEAVILSHARLTYTLVAQMLDGKSAEHPDLLPHLKEFQNLYNQLSKQRHIRGAIEFDTTETKIVFGEQGKIDYIQPVHRNVAHRMIEEAMLLANVSTAHYLHDAGILTLYRVHEGPDEQKLLSLRDFLKALGLRLSGGQDPQPKDYAKLLQRVNKRIDAHIIQTVMLRSLRQAIYSPDSAGHFGLAYELYCHFTSPIRRYPDVLVHRAIKHLIRGKKPSKFPYDEDAMLALGEQCSMTERRADDATREAVDWLKCEYMMDKVGQEFAGVISGVTGFGLFIELQEIYVEGLLHISGLENDYFQFDATHHVLRGRQSGKAYRLGDEIRVLVARVDLDQRQIDFELA